MTTTTTETRCPAVATDSENREHRCGYLLGYHNCYQHRSVAGYFWSVEPGDAAYDGGALDQPAPPSAPSGETGATVKQQRAQLHQQFAAALPNRSEAVHLFDLALDRIEKADADVASLRERVEKAEAGMFALTNAAMEIIGTERERAEKAEERAEARERDREPLDRLMAWYYEHYQHLAPAEAAIKGPALVNTYLAARAPSTPSASTGEPT